MRISIELRGLTAIYHSDDPDRMYFLPLHDDPFHCTLSDIVVVCKQIQADQHEHPVGNQAVIRSKGD